MSTHRLALRWLLPFLLPRSLAITDNQHHQTTSITDAYQHPVAMTYAGAGQGERLSADWSNQPNPPTGQPAEYGRTSYTNSALGLASKADSTVTTYYTRDPAGLLVGERTLSRTYYFVFDGLGNVAMLVDPPSGAPVAIPSPLPTGNQSGDQWEAPGTRALDELPFQQGGAFQRQSDVGTGPTQPSLLVLLVNDYVTPTIAWHDSLGPGRWLPEHAHL